ncbi:hypothetical protein RN001_005353 [Aquatica leii]|uniref:Uncharacterized protein n=1 Tax=Aquatica leii TaxID=1421715 RepID=A0AAN7Q0B3_9COLE|nr:hypothetical protein RN001_005353 [Aquatica leii]
MCSTNDIAEILHATQINDIEFLKRTIKKSNLEWCQVQYEKTGDTVLHIAARLGYLDLLKFFLETSSVDVKNKDDKTPLHEAAQFSQSEVIALLLEHGATVDALKRADWTPLMLACTKITEESYKCVELLLQKRALLNLANKDGWSALHLISREGSGPILQLLCNHGLDIFVVTKNGRTALHVACLHGHLEIVKLLLNFGLKVDVVDNCGNTPLHESILGGCVEICDYLLRYGADLNAVNNIGYGVMHLAASVGHLSVIKYLVQKSVDVNSSTVNGKFTPLHCAARKQHNKTVALLMQLGANEFKDSFGRYPSDY